MLQGARDGATKLLRWAKTLVGGKDEYNPEPKIGKREALPMSPKTPTEYVDYMNKRYDRWYQARYPFEAAWYLDVAFYLGLQWHEWSEQHRALREPRAPSWRVRYVVNQCMPVIETMVGKMTRGQPDLTCSPMQSPSDRAFVDARVSDKLLKGLRDPLGLVDVDQLWMYWGFICGHSYVKTMWDPTAGRSINIPGQPPMAEGDIREFATGPYAILTPPHLKNMITDPYEFIDCRMYDIEHARMLFPEVADKIQPKRDQDRATAFEDRLTQLVSPLGYTGFGDKQASQSSNCMVKELWQSPQVLTQEEREQFPDGRVIIVIDNVFVDAMPNPYGFNPLTDMRAKIIPGRYLGGSTIDQMMSSQRNLNHARSDVIWSRMLCARPMINVEAGHGIVKPIAEPGKWLERRKGWAAPVFLDPPRMSEYHMKDLADTREDFMQTSQVREVTRGQVPAANITGVAINLLQEADNTPLGPLAQRIAYAYGQRGTKMIKLAQKFYKEPRMLSVVGEGRETEVLEFLGDRHPTELTVRCSIDSVLPESRAARQQRTLEAIQAGALDPVRHPDKVRRMLEFGDPGEVWDDQDAHAAKARRENRALTAGQFLPVDTFDDDIVHMSTHDRFRVSTEYEQLPPQIKMLFEQHCNMHLDKQRAIAMAGAAPQQPQVGQPAPPASQPAVRQPPPGLGGESSEM